MTGIYIYIHRERERERKRERYREMTIYEVGHSFVSSKGLVNK